MPAVQPWALLTRHSQTLPHHVSRHEQRHSDSCIRIKTEGTFHPSACSSGLNERAKLLLFCACVSFNTRNFFSNSSNMYPASRAALLLPHPWNSKCISSANSGLYYFCYHFT